MAQTCCPKTKGVGKSTYISAKMARAGRIFYPFATGWVVREYESVAPATCPAILFLQGSTINPEGI